MSGGGQMLDQVAGEVEGVGQGNELQATGGGADPASEELSGVAAAPAPPGASKGVSEAAGDKAGGDASLAATRPRRSRAVRTTVMRRIVDEDGTEGSAGRPTTSGKVGRERGGGDEGRSDAPGSGPLFAGEPGGQGTPEFGGMEPDGKGEDGLELIGVKVLTQSDTGHGGRIVLPKLLAENHLPYLDRPGGVKLPILDSEGKMWHMQFRYWPNKHGRMYLLENVGDFLDARNLGAGDALEFTKSKDGSLGITIVRNGTRPPRTLPCSKKSKGERPARPKRPRSRNDSFGLDSRAAGGRSKPPSASYAGFYGNHVGYSAATNRSDRNREGSTRAEVIAAAHAAAMASASAATVNNTADGAYAAGFAAGFSASCGKLTKYQLELFRTKFSAMVDEHRRQNMLNGNKSARLTPFGKAAEGRAAYEAAISAVGAASQAGPVGGAAINGSGAYSASAWTAAAIAPPIMSAASASALKHAGASLSAKTSSTSGPRADAFPVPQIQSLDGYEGLSRTSGNKWMASYWQDGKNHCLGIFETQAEALVARSRIKESGGFVNMSVATNPDMLNLGGQVTTAIPMTLALSEDLSGPEGKLVGGETQQLSTAEVFLPPVQPLEGKSIPVSNGSGSGGITSTAITSSTTDVDLNSGGGRVLSHGIGSGT